MTAYPVLVILPSSVRRSLFCPKNLIISQPPNPDSLPSAQAFSAVLRKASSFHESSYRLFIILRNDRDLFSDGSVSLYHPTILSFHMLRRAVGIIQPCLDIRGVLFIRPKCESMYSSDMARQMKRIDGKYLSSKSCLQSNGT